MATLWLSLIGFISGAVPWSIILGRLAGGRDIRRYGDGNPGAFNVLRASGPVLFVAAALLDGFKGAIPVGYAWFVAGVEGWRVVPIALAPVLGHAFSPFLLFRGGKAVAVSFGIWLGLAGPWAPFVIGGLLFISYKLLASSGWAVMATAVVGGALAWFLHASIHPWFMAVWGGNVILLALKHRAELAAAPRLRQRERPPE